MDDWQRIVRELEARGWSLTGLAREVEASIGAIADLKQGRTKEPRASVGLKLHALHGSGRTPSDQQETRDAA